LGAFGYGEIVRRLFVVLLLAACPVAVAAAPSGDWRALEPLPVARTEVAAAVVGRELAIAGGFLADGSSSRRVDLYSPASGEWRRAPDLPIAVNHGMAATLGGRLVVVGGYAAGGATRGAFVLEGRQWRALPQLPSRRAAGGAVVIAGTLYVVGGVGPSGLAKSTFVYEPAKRRWRALPGPTPREHLAVAAAGGSIYAIAGRTAGIDTNLDLVETWKPGEAHWQRLAPVPEPRGGTAAAFAQGLIVSVGGEAPQGTLGRVFGYDVAKGAWRALPELPTPRHGLGVVALGGVVYAIGGGPQPGLHVSAANEALTLG
jgi:N-acetylneuraminic acid mutarotase